MDVDTQVLLQIPSITAMPGFDQTKQNTLYVLKFRKFEKKVLKLGRKINNKYVNMGQKKTNTASPVQVLKLKMN